jgi:hypothetical protein
MLSETEMKRLLLSTDRIIAKDEEQFKTLNRLRSILFFDNPPRLAVVEKPDNPNCLRKGRIGE